MKKEKPNYEELAKKVLELEKLIESTKNTHDIETNNSNINRNNQETGLNDNEQRFRSIIENAGAGYFFIDNEYIIQDVNEAWIKLYKYDNREEVIGQHFSIIQKLDDKVLAKEFVDGIRRSDKRYMEGEFSRKCKDNSIGYHNFSAWPVIKHGEIVGIEGFILDITENIITKEKLKISEEKFRSYTLHSPIGIYITDAVGDCVFANEKWLEMAGLTLEEAMGKGWIQALHPDDKELIRENWYKSVQSNGNWLYDYRFVNRQGKVSWVRGSAKELRNAENKITGYLGSNIDITECKLAEEQSKVFAKIPEENVNPVIRISENGTLLYSNPASKELISGYFPETGCKVSEPWIKKINESLHSGQKHREEIDIDGKIFSFEFAPITDGNYVNLYGRDITIRKNAENELRKSEEKFRSIFENNSSAIAIIEADTTISMVNDAYCEMGGYTREEVIGTSWTKQIPPEDLIRLKEYNQRRLINPKDAPGKYEFTFYHKSGKIKHGLISVSMLQGEKKIIVSFTDITERKLLEEKLKENIDLLRIAGEKAKLGGWNVLLKENRSYWSDEVAAIHEMPAGYSPLVEDGINFYAPEWRERITKVFTDCAMKGISYDEEMEIITANGKRVWVKTIGEAVKDDNGKIYKVQGSFQDITERIRAEEKLSSISKLQEAILASVPEIIMEVDNNKTYVWANNAGKEFFGNDVVGKDAACFFEGEQDVYDIVKPLFNGDESIIYVESWQRRKDGEKRLLAWWCKVLKDKNGNVNGALSTARDITEQKLAEYKLKKSEERYTLLMKSTDLGFVVLDEQGIVVTANEPYHMIIGMKENERCIGRSVIEWTAPDEKKNNVLAVEQCVKQGYIKDFETIYQHPDGKREYVLINANMQKSAEGKNHIVSFCRNITERKLVERDLEMLNVINSDLNKGMSLDDMLTKSKQMINKAFPVNHVDIYLTSDDGRFLLYQKENIKKEFITTFEKILPFKIPQTIKLSLYKDNWYSRVMLGKEIKITETTSDIEAMIMAFVESNYEKIPFKKHLSKIITFFKDNSIISSIPLILKEKNIALLDVNFKTRPTENDLKRIKSFSEQLVVIIDRKRTEEALRNSEAKFHALYDNMIEGAALHELTYNDQGMPEDYIIIDVNSAFEKQLGLSRVNIIGKTSREAYGVNEPPYFEKYVRVVHTNEPEVFETYFSPMEKYFSISAYCPYKGCFATIFEDITERKKAEEKIKQHNELLLKLNVFSVELSVLPLENDLETFIIKHLKEITGAEVALFNEYDHDKKAVIVKHIEMNPGLLEKVIGLLGRQVKKIQSPVSEEIYQEMVTEVIGKRTSLHDVSFGAISRPVGVAIQALLKVDRFIGMSYQIDGKLYGTSLIALKKGQPDIQDEILETFVYLATMAISRRKSDLALRENEEIFRHFMEFSPVYVFFKDEKIRSLKLSKNYETMLGKPIAELIGKNMDELFPSEFAKKMVEDDIRVLKSGNETTIEEEFNNRKYTTIKFPIIIDGKPKYLAGYTIDITETKLAEKALRESEEKFSKAFMTSPYAISITDAKTGQFIEVNDHFSLMSGYSREEILTNSSIGLEMWINMEDRKQVIADIIKGKKVSGKEYKFLKKNREILVGLFSADLISLNNKSYILSSINDITESVNAKDALFESEKKYRLLADNSADVIFIFDMNFKYTYVSPSVTRLRGYDPEELIGQSISNSIKSEGIAITQSVIKEELELERKGIADPNRSRTIELEMLCKDGSAIWTEVKASVLRDDKKNPIGIIGVTRDITERKKAENALIKSKEKTEELLTITQKQKSEIELQNERLESLLRISQYKPESNQDLLDYALKEAIELTSSKIGYIYFYNEETKQFTLNTWSKDVMNECSVLNPQAIYDLDKTGLWGEAVRQRKPIVINNYSEENECKKGMPQGHVQLSKFLTIPVFIDGNIVAVVGVANKEEDYQLSDIRQLTLLMNSVWRSSERENMIENLKKSKENAEESDRLKSAFLANMSHEIRTPMNGILGFAELLTEPGLSGEKQKEYIHIIENSGKRMLNIINDIVDISKIESGQVELSISMVNINEQIEYLDVFFKPEIEQKGMQIFFKNSLTNDEANVRTDKVKVVAILTNLVKNAIKFTRQGTIEFGYVKKDEFLQFFVKDTGLGISQEQKDIIFERFRQGSESLTRNYEGAGLGLSISKAYVEMLGGRIWVESNEGKGSIFYFTIPYNIVQKETGVIYNAISKNEKEIHNKKLKILIADDEETSEKLISIVVGKFSNEILTARNGVEAVELCRKNPDIDLIMMDVKMPEMNGYEATKQIREFNNKVIIIAQTAYALAGENEKAIAAGCNDYISKPINKDKLTELIQKYFKK